MARKRPTQRHRNRFSGSKMITILIVSRSVLTKMEIELVVSVSHCLFVLQCYMRFKYIHMVEFNIFSISSSYKIPNAIKTRLSCVRKATTNEASSIRNTNFSKFFFFFNHINIGIGCEMIQRFAARGCVYDEVDWQHFIHFFIGLCCVLPLP